MKKAKELVRRGYDKVSHAYRSDHFDPEDDPYYSRNMNLLLSHLKAGSRILDLGCGNGIPACRDLAEEHSVTGIDISPVQIERARALVPAVDFRCEEMTQSRFPPNHFDAVISLYAIIHVPLEEQRGLFQRIAGWLKPGGRLLVTVGQEAWTGTEENWLGVPGGTMYWSHADRETYLAWLGELGFLIEDVTFIPEGKGGHVAILARKQPGEST
ncbi:MAG: class I SAM-dependent methyltransferase [bacterium]|nr:class I SAM-dependent methyltransferase [bacterium]